MTGKWIAERPQMGTWTHRNHLLCWREKKMKCGTNSKTIGTDPVMVLILVLLLSACFKLAAAVGAETSGGEQPVITCVLPFQCEQTLIDSSGLSETVHQMIETIIASNSKLQLIPKPTTSYALNKVKISDEKQLSKSQLCVLGEMVKADAIVSGFISKSNQVWTIKGNLITLPSGEQASSESSETNLAKAVQLLTTSLINKNKNGSRATLPVDYTKLWSDDANALGIYEKAMGEANFEKKQNFLKTTVNYDALFGQAHLALAATLGSMGNLPDAERAARQAISLVPNYYKNHEVLGAILAFKGDYFQSDVELKKAVSLNKFDSEAYLRLAQIKRIKGDLEESKGYLQLARELDPLNWENYAQLAVVDVSKGDEEHARKEAYMAVELSPPTKDEANVLGDVFLQLKEPFLAIGYYKMFLDASKENGLNPNFVEGYKQLLVQLQLRLQPHFFSESMPQALDQKTLSEKMSGLLSPEEFSELEYPFECSPLMYEWAKQKTKGFTNELEKITALFNAVSAKFEFDNSSGRRFAKQIFDTAKDKQKVNCLEGANIFVVLSRAVGISACLADVSLDFENQLVNHCCCAVSLENKVILIDPSYQWLGVPHKKFRLLTDIEAIGANYFSSGGLMNDQLGKNFGVAYKTYPNCEWGVYNYILWRISCGQWTEARQLIDRLRVIAPESWYYFESKAFEAGHLGDEGLAVTDFTLASLLKLKDAALHYNLAAALFSNRMFDKAAKEYAEALKCSTSERERNEMANQIKKLQYN